MDLEQIVQWIIIGIVLVIGLSVLGFLLDIAVGLLGFGVKILIIVLVIVAVLRFLQYLGGSSGHRTN